jgi:hypothetical protein
MLGEGPKLVPENGTVVILQKYILTLFPSWSQASYFSWLMPAVGAILALILGALRRLTRGDSGETKIVIPALISMAIGFGISLLWILAMKNHALEPGHWLFLPRHLIIFLFSCVLVSVVALSTLSRMSMALLARSQRFR